LSPRGLSFFLPAVLTGAEVGNGNLRSTALVVLLLGVPTLLTAMAGTARGSSRWLVVWLGTLGYLLYQAVLFCFATPLNALFLFYVASPWRVSVSPPTSGSVRESIRPRPRRR
jgi:hypothetical protein